MGHVRMFRVGLIPLVVLCYVVAHVPYRVVH